MENEAQENEQRLFLKYGDPSDKITENHQKIKAMTINLDRLLQKDGKMKLVNINPNKDDITLIECIEENLVIYT